MKILVVDDAPEISILMEDILSPLGFEVDSAPSAERALEKIRKSKPDLILLDVMMPGKDGYEFCADLKTSDFRKIPVIFVSVKRDKSEIEKGLKLGAADYVTKPFDPDDLVKRVQRVLGERK